jgi:hypothetical protein
MKKLLFAALFSMQLATVLVAQPASSDQVVVYQSDKNRIGKSEVKISAIRNFVKQFGDVENATWSSKEDGFRVNFTRNNTKFMVDYDQKGKWFSTTQVYDEADMGRALRNVVRSNYIDYTIVKVIEVRLGKSHVHFVKMENQSSLLTLHIMNGEITEVEKYNKR